MTEEKTYKLPPVPKQSVLCKNLYKTEKLKHDYRNAYMTFSLCKDILEELVSEDDVQQVWEYADTLIEKIDFTQDKMMKEIVKFNKTFECNYICNRNER